MGIDPSKFNSKDVNFNIDISSIKDAISGGADLAEMFNNIGFRVEQRPSRKKDIVNIDFEDESEVEGIQDLPLADLSRVDRSQSGLSFEDLHLEDLYPEDLSLKNLLLDD